MKLERGSFMSFGDRLKVTRKQKGFSQEDLAEMLDVSRQSVTKWETGISYPEIRTLLELSCILEKDLDWLFSDEIIDRRMPGHIRQDMSIAPDAPIEDRETLNKAILQDILLRMIHVLDGFEIVRSLETEEFSGIQTCIFYGGRVYAQTDGIDPKSDERIQSFAQMSSREIRDLLLPWSAVGRTQIDAQLQVAEKHL